MLAFQELLNNNYINQPSSLGTRLLYGIWQTIVIFRPRILYKNYINTPLNTGLEYCVLYPEPFVYREPDSFLYDNPIKKHYSSKDHQMSSSISQYISVNLRASWSIPTKNILETNFGNIGLRIIFTKKKNNSNNTTYQLVRSLLSNVFHL